MHFGNTSRWTGCADQFEPSPVSFMNAPVAFGQ